MKMPSVIKNHAGVQSTEFATDTYDKKYSVQLKDDWYFMNLSGGECLPGDYDVRQWAAFKTAKEFVAAKPTRFKFKL
ncbi:hypothetical protein D3C85_691540 [compost metagenome]